MKKLFFIIFSLVISNQFIYSQKETPTNQLLEEAESFINNHIKRRTSEKNSDALVYLRDSTYHTSYGDGEEVLYKSYFTYNIQGDIVEYLMTNNAIYFPTPSVRREYNYNSDNTLSSWTSYKWDSDNEIWANCCKYECTYDTNQNLVVVIYSNWDSDGQSWEYSYKYKSIFDSDNNEIEKYRFNWYTSQQMWVQKKIFYNSYNSNNSISTQEEYWWHSTLEDWYLVYTTHYSYTDSNRIVEELILDSSMNEIRKVAYIYHGGLLETKFFLYAHTNSHGEVVWYWDSYTNYSYDEYENMVYEYTVTICPSYESYHYYSEHALDLSTIIFSDNIFMKSENLSFP